MWASPIELNHISKNDIAFVCLTKGGGRVSRSYIDLPGLPSAEQFLKKEEVGRGKSRRAVGLVGSEIDPEVRTAIRNSANEQDLRT